MVHKHAAAPAAKMTHNQETVLAVLKRAGKPLSAYQILDQTAAGGLRAPPQVYRALEKLLELKLIHRVETLNAYLFCDHGPHADEVAFAICETCGSVSEIPLRAIRPALKKSAAAHGFAFHDANVEIHGSCGTCAARGE